MIIVWLMSLHILGGKSINKDIVWVKVFLSFDNLFLMNFCQIWPCVTNEPSYIGWKKINWLRYSLWVKVLLSFDNLLWMKFCQIWPGKYKWIWIIVYFFNFWINDRMLLSMEGCVSDFTSYFHLFCYQKKKKKWKH